MFDLLLTDFIFSVNARLTKASIKNTLQGMCSVSGEGVGVIREEV